MIGWLEPQESAMTICPNCQHQNFDRIYCETCEAPLAATTPCPTCGGAAQANARYCGDCGFEFEQGAVPRLGDLDSRPLLLVGPPVQSATGNYGEAETQLQQQAAHLLHVQSDTAIALPQTLTVIHIGKPNHRVPPHIDVAGFPNSEAVSRIHSDIRLEGDTYFIEDMDSANGTYINHTVLPTGNRHRLRHGDRIALGKGDLMTFLFQRH